MLEPSIQQQVEVFESFGNPIVKRCGSQRMELLISRAEEF